MNPPRFTTTGRTHRILQWIREYESRNVTCIEPDGSWPIVWNRARGPWVWDVDGKRYLDLTAAFGVAAAGHAHPKVVRAGQHQMARLLHAMGDVHPHALKAQLARELSRITFERWPWPPAASAGKNQRRGKTIFCNSGFEAVEAALKTARLATGKPGVIAFHGAYHGLGYGALNATHRDHFRKPFEDQLGGFGHFVPFPRNNSELKPMAARIRRLSSQRRVGTILVEPIQGRAGVIVPPLQFLSLLRQLCDELGLLLVADEIYTGFGRTGRWFACEHAEVTPDLICLGKALTGGFPLSACVGRWEVMDAAWPLSEGEAMHTSTFLGHPVGCAMALAQMRTIHAEGLVTRSAPLGEYLREQLSGLKPPAGLKSEVRGLGLMMALELKDKRGKPATRETIAVIKSMLRRGFILLPEGPHSSVISFSPPLTITRSQIRSCVCALSHALSDVGAP